MILATFPDPAPLGLLEVVCLMVALADAVGRTDLRELYLVELIGIIVGGDA